MYKVLMPEFMCAFTDVNRVEHFGKVLNCGKIPRIPEWGPGIHITDSGWSYHFPYSDSSYGKLYFL